MSVGICSKKLGFLFRMVAILNSFSKTRVPYLIVFQFQLFFFQNVTSVHKLVLSFPTKLTMRQITYTNQFSIQTSKTKTHVFYSRRARVSYCVLVAVNGNKRLSRTLKPASPTTPVVWWWWFCCCVDRCAWWTRGYLFCCYCWYRFRCAKMMRESPRRWHVVAASTWAMHTRVLTVPDLRGNVPNRSVKSVLRNLS